jgi:hypothetical protein
MLGLLMAIIEEIRTNYMCNRTFLVNGIITNVVGFNGS